MATCSGGNWPGNEYYGINAPGGAGTYIAYSINAAQAALAADSARKATPVMIVLSDGDASTQPTGSTDPCHEAIVAADAAATAGHRGLLDRLRRRQHLGQLHPGQRRLRQPDGLHDHAADRQRLNASSTA